LRLPLADEAPARDTTIRISVPKDSPFHFRFEGPHMLPPNPRIEKTDYTTTYTWVYAWPYNDITEWQADPLTASDNQPALLISTFPDWKTFAGWYERITRLADEATADITNKAIEVTRAVQTDREKIGVLYNYVAGLRYVAVPLGVNSFRPHTAGRVLRNQYGDCKDKANLLNVLLRSQGIDAHLVLVPRFGRAYTNLPGFAFNHAISCVRLRGETLWLDTTDDACRFGMLPPGDVGRNVLVIDGNTDALTALPNAESKNHVVQLTTKVHVSDFQGDATATIRVQATGYADYKLRTIGRSIGKRSSMPLLSGAFRLMNGSLALHNQDFTSPSDLDRDFVLGTAGKLIGICGTDTSHVTLRAPLWLPAEWTVALHQRKEPLFLNEGYPLLFHQRVEFKLASGGSRMRLPPDIKNGDGPLRWSLVWSYSPEQALVVSLDCELAKGELSREETIQFQKQVRELFSALAQTASFSFPNINKE